MSERQQYTVDTSELGFDPGGLVSKYYEERDKRALKEGFGPYQEIRGEFSNFIDDHYVEPGYYNNEGYTGNNNGFLSGQFGGSDAEFFKILSDWREGAELKGLEIN